MRRLVLTVALCFIVAPGVSLAAGGSDGAADQATLFTKFTRLRSRHGDQDIPGAGLGLAACRLLADIMGGSVGVVSGEGRGARFFLRLPLAAAAAAEAPPPAGSNLPNTTVLLVEDTDYNAWAASAVLARLDRPVELWQSRYAASCHRCGGGCGEQAIRVRRYAQPRRRSYATRVAGAHRLARRQ